MAEKFLDGAGIAYEKVYANKDAEAAKQFGVNTAPTLVVIKDGKAEKIVNVSNIRKFIETAKA
jgi:ribonucleoside-triphosphate reductase